MCGFHLKHPWNIFLSSSEQAHVSKYGHIMQNINFIYIQNINVDHLIHKLENIQELDKHSVDRS